MRGMLQGGARGRVLAAIAILALAVTASAALAGAKLKTKSASTTVPAQETESVTAKCKRGQAAISGGFEGDVDGERVLTIANHNEGARKYTTTAKNFDNDADPATLTGYAYCREAERLRAKQKEVTIPVSPTLFVNSTATVTAKCKKGEKVMSGGFEGGTPDVLPYSSRKDGGRKWTVSAVNYSVEATGSLTAFAVCADQQRLKTRSASSAPIGSLETGGATAKCKRSQRVISGGFDNPDFDPDVTGAQIFGYASMKLGKREWTASGFDLGDSSGAFTVYAYCEKKRTE